MAQPRESPERVLLFLNLILSQLGTWSVPCEAFKWNPETTLAKKHESMTRCKKIQEDNVAASYQPRRRHLRVVAKVVRT